MSIVNYGGKEYDLETLVRIGGRGINIRVNLEELCDKETKALSQKNTFENGQRLLVAANGDKYDILVGALALMPNGQPSRTQQCWLMSKFVLKSACTEVLKNSVIDTAPQRPQHMPYEDRYESRPRYNYPRNNRY